MISAEFAVTMARYNAWQNRSHYHEAARLTDSERKADRGAFFKSIHGTLCHILMGDQIWMHRLAGTAPPRAKSIAESPFAYPSFSELTDERQSLDRLILEWAGTLESAWLAGDVTWTTMAGDRRLTRPAWLLVAHMFNHQTHHRGQVHAMLTAAGMKPEDTDLPFMPEG